MISENAARFLAHRLYRRWHPWRGGDDLNVDDATVRHWLADLSDRDLLSMRNVGRVGLRAVREWSETHRMGDPVWGQPE